jgi:hypothetical protein
LVADFEKAGDMSRRKRPADHHFIDPATISIIWAASASFLPENLTVSPDFRITTMLFPSDPIAFAVFCNYHARRWIPSFVSSPFPGALFPKFRIPA